MHLVKDLLHWLLKYQKEGHVKNQFEKQFTSVLQYPDIEPFSKPFSELPSSSWPGKAIQGMISTTAVNWPPNFDSSTNDVETSVEIASDRMVMGGVRAFNDFSVLVSQHSHSDLSLIALGNALKRFCKVKDVFWEHDISKLAKTRVDEQCASESR
jgi:hypothetical protein